MGSDERRFWGVLTLVFGPLFIAGGWLAAFTDVGLVLIFAGSLMLLVSPVLLHSCRAVPVVALLLALGWGWPWLLSL